MRTMKTRRWSGAPPGDDLIQSDPLRSLEIELHRPGRPSAPAQKDADIARHAARIVDDFEAHVIAARLELALPEFIDLLGNAGQCLLPAFLGLVDGAAVVGADVIGKAEHLDGRHAVLDRAVDDDCCLFHDLVVRQAGGPGQPVEQRLLLGLRRFMRLHRLGRLLALHLGDLRHQFLGAEYVRHDVSPWVTSIPSAFKGPASGWRSGRSCVPSVGTTQTATDAPGALIRPAPSLLRAVSSFNPSQPHPAATSARVSGSCSPMPAVKTGP